MNVYTNKLWLALILSVCSKQSIRAGSWTTPLSTKSILYYWKLQENQGSGWNRHVFWLPNANKTWYNKVI